MAERFAIAGFPTLHMFSKGKMYTYDRSPAGRLADPLSAMAFMLLLTRARRFRSERNYESIYEWARGGFRKSAGIDVPLG